MENVPTFLLTQGVLGVACLVLGLVVIKLYNKIERLEKEKADIMEARRLDSVQSAKDAYEVIGASTDNMRILTEKIEISKAHGRSR